MEHSSFSFSEAVRFGRLAAGAAVLVFASLPSADAAEFAVSDHSIAQFPRLAGETDDAPRFQRAVDACRGGGLLTVPGGNYTLSHTVFVTNLCSVEMSPGARIKAVAEMDWMFKIDQRWQYYPKSAPKDVQPEIYNLSFRGGTLDADGKASCLAVDNYRHFTLENSTFLNARRYGVAIETEGLGYEMVARNLYFKTLVRGLAGNTAIFTCGGDSQYTDIIIVDYTVGFHVFGGGANRLTRVHVWGGPVGHPAKKGEVPEMLRDSVCFRIEGGSTILRDCYADTGAVGFWNTGRTTQMFGCLYFNNTGFGLKDVTVLRQDGGSLWCEGCNFRRNTPVTRLYEASPGSMLCWADNNICPGFECATGVSFPIICIANAFAWCVGDGAASYLSICSGRKDTESAHKCVGTGIVVTTIISIFLLIICESFATPLMSLFGASDQTINMAVLYFQIVAAFFPFYLLLNVMNSMIRADGAPRYAMIAMLLGAIINIALDPLFIFGFKWGIAGAAWATAIGQVASFIMCAVYFFKPKSVVLSLKSFIPDISILRNIISLGAATFVTQISVAVLTLVSNMTLARYGELSMYGKDIPISVFSIQTKVYTIVYSIITGIVLGGQPIFGYNYGAGKFDRVRKTYKIVLTSTVIIGVVFTLLFQLKPEWIINIFGGGDALYIEFAIKTFKIYLSLMTITCLVKMTAVFFQSIGKSVRAVVASLIRDILCFTPVVIILSSILENDTTGSGINGILYAAPISDFISIFVVIILTVTFFKNLAKDENLKVESTEEIKGSRPGFIITISREHGSRGKQIGMLVAERLNIPFYYKEMIAIAARESGLDEEFIANMNINAPNVMYDMYLGTDAVKQSIIAQEKIIRKIADNGACVIVGRACDYVLRDYKNVINIFIHAPKELRIQNIMEMYNDNIQEATENVKKSDYARSSFYRNISGKKWNDPTNYTMCLDSSIGLDVCVEQICNLYNSMK